MEPLKELTGAEIHDQIVSFLQKLREATSQPPLSAKVLERDIDKYLAKRNNSHHT